VRSSIKYIDAELLTWNVTRLDDNALVVDYAEFRIEPGGWRGPFPILAIKEWLDDQRYVGPLSVRYMFDCEFRQSPPPSLKLVVEGVERPGVKVKVNGHPVDVSTITENSWRDPHWHPFPLEATAIRTQNCVEVAFDQFHFADPAAADPIYRTGTELESVMVLGDFAVAGTETTGPQDWQDQIEHHTGTPLADWLPPQRMRYLIRPFVLRPERALSTGDVTCKGLPFYAGRVRYDAELTGVKSGDDTRVLLRLATMNAAVAAVEVNGKPAGHFAWPPLELDITPLLSYEHNQLTIIAYHSLRNLLGPHHHPAGEPVYVTPGSFRPEGCTDWIGAIENGQNLPAWKNSYLFVEFGLMNSGMR
jgi:hypothetical protein